MEFGICDLSVIPVRSAASDEAEIVTQLLFGEGLEVLEHNNQWRKVRCLHDNYEGWTDFKLYKNVTISELDNHLKDHFRLDADILQITSEAGPQMIYRGSVLPKGTKDKFSIGQHQFKVVNASELSGKTQLLDQVQAFLNVPYLWGGRSFVGIDCSGLTQVVFAYYGKVLLRDAYQQEAEGDLIEFNDRQAGDLPYFSNSKGKVTHVGILLDKDKIIHAHGRVRIDKLDEKGIYNAEQGRYTHLLTSIKRL